jgi:hypothetical protein
MSTLRQIADKVIRKGENGISVDESKYDLEFIYAKIHDARATAIFEQWQKTKRINTLWTQKYTPTYNEYIQDADGCVVYFSCPGVISLDGLMDGFLYIGQVDCNSAFRKVESRAKLASFNNYRHTKNSTNIARVIHSDGLLEVWGNTFIEQIQVDAVFSNPTQVDTYVVDYDQYPVDSKIENRILELLFAQDLRYMQGPIDIKSDSQDTKSVLAMGGAK